MRGTFPLLALATLSVLVCLLPLAHSSSDAPFASLMDDVDQERDDARAVSIAQGVDGMDDNNGVDNQGEGVVVVAKGGDGEKKREKLGGSTDAMASVGGKVTEADGRRRTRRTTTTRRRRVTTRRRNRRRNRRRSSSPPTRMVDDRKLSPRGYSGVPTSLRPVMANTARGIARSVRTELGRPLSASEMASVEASIGSMFRANSAREKRNSAALRMSSREENLLKNALGLLKPRHRKGSLAWKERRGLTASPRTWERFLKGVRRGRYWKPPRPIFDKDTRDKYTPEPGVSSPGALRRAWLARRAAKARAKSLRRAAAAKRARAARIRSRARALRRSVSRRNGRGGRRRSVRRRNTRRRRSIRRGRGRGRRRRRRRRRSNRRRSTRSNRRRRRRRGTRRTSRRTTTRRTVRRRTRRASDDDE